VNLRHQNDRYAGRKEGPEDGELNRKGTVDYDFLSFPIDGDLLIDGLVSAGKELEFLSLFDPTEGTFHAPTDQLVTPTTNQIWRVRFTCNSRTVIVVDIVSRR